MSPGEDNAPATEVAYEPPAVEQIDVTEGPCESVSMLSSTPA